MIQVQGLKKEFVIRHNPLARLSHPDHIIRAVDGVSFEINEGEILGLVGESGCGKTTLAKTMLRLYLPTAGNVTYWDRDIFGIGRKELKLLRRKVQFIFQDSSSTLDPRMTVGRILEEPLRLHGAGDGNWRRQRVAEMMQKVKLSPAFISRHPAELSGGQRQRLSMGRALILEPRFVIADEPLAGLDPLVSMQLLHLMLSLKDEFGLTYLFISHDLGTVARASDRIAVMYRGKLVELMDARRFETEARHHYTRSLIAAGLPLPVADMNNGVHIHDHSIESGCAFRERCPVSKAICVKYSPELREIGPGHTVACHNES